MSASTSESRVRTSTSGRAVDRAERLWLLVTLTLVGSLLWWYVVGHHQVVDREFVFTSGVMGTVLAVLAASLSIRKRLAYQGPGKMSAWLNGHIYLGFVSAVAIFLHCGFRTGGTLTSVLLPFYSLTVVSGLLGLVIARRIPRLLTAIEENPALMEDLIGIRSDCLRGLHELAEGGSREYRSVVRTRLFPEACSMRRIMRFYQKRSTLAQEMPAFQKELEESMRHLKSHEHRSFQRAAEYALRANKMNAELLLQRVLRGWLTFHMAATVIMFALAAAHIFTVLFY